MASSGELLPSGVVGHVIVDQPHGLREGKCGGGSDMLVEFWAGARWGLRQ